ncbi:unnamed protein product [Leptidea sinapis]|uniref:Uncharacterized protein n=1 Tax=Leptidea sinapis TaxID=189913 RepID=A0A5E4PN65_9NEOP|nr:unnamed protein product [Leptidea sinapis]
MSGWRPGDSSGLHIVPAEKQSLRPRVSPCHISVPYW